MYPALLDLNVDQPTNTASSRMACSRLKMERFHVHNQAETSKTECFCKSDNLHTLIPFNDQLFNHSSTRLINDQYFIHSFNHLLIHSSKHVFIISFPRDIFINLNHVYFQWGENQRVWKKLKRGKKRRKKI